VPVGTIGEAIIAALTGPHGEVGARRAALRSVPAGG
jgi:hypothetical protein